MRLVIYDKNGVEYGKVCTSTRQGKNIVKNCSNLSRVLNRNAGIYQSRERGIFTYDLATNAYGKAPASFVPPAKSHGNEKLMLDFGDAFALDKFIDSSGIAGAIGASGYFNPDRAKAVVSCSVLCK